MYLNISCEWVIYLILCVDTVSGGRGIIQTLIKYNLCSFAKIWYAGHKLKIMNILRKSETLFQEIIVWN